MQHGKLGAVEKETRSAKPWPAWTRWVVSVAILFHGAAVLAGALAAPPASGLEQEVAEFFGPYHQVLDQGDSYRYYSSAFPPTPVVTATLSFADGRPDKVVRLPERGLRPRLLFQRQLALAHGLMEDFEAARRSPSGDGTQSRWAHSFATHLGRSNPGCSSVSLELKMHLVPRIERIKHLLEKSDGPVDLDSDEFYSDPQHIGVFPCDAS